jgi:hypothetical protein
MVHLLREVEKFPRQYALSKTVLFRKFLRQSDTAPTRFGRDVVGDPRFVFDLRNGRDPRPRTVKRVLAYIEAVQ